MSEEAQQGAEGAPAEAPAEQPAPEADSGPAPSFASRLFGKKRNLFLIIAVVVIVAVAAVGVGALGGGGNPFSKKAAAAPAKMTAMDGSISIPGPQVPAGQTQDFPIQFNSSGNSSEVTNVYEVTAACTWTDDYAGSEPDSMTFELVSPDGKNDSKTTDGTSGNCQVSIKISNMTDKKVDDNTKDWKLSVTCNYAGHKDVGPFGFLVYLDAGNNFDAKVAYKYYGYPAKK
jgi:hypothetical protein